MNIAEVVGMEGDLVVLQDLFRFRRTGLGADGHALGRFEACGIRPKMIDRLLAEGFELPGDLFQRRELVAAGGSA